MKKLIHSLITVVTLCYSNFIFSGTTKTINQAIWHGFYLGGNAGYWRSQNNNVDTTGTTGFINQTFEWGASNIADALAEMATNDFSLHAHGFIGGGQVGYNYQFNEKFLLGLDVDFDGLTNSNNTHTVKNTVDLVDFDENYEGSLVVKQKINYIGTLRARFGYLLYPTFLVYGTGGFAYGNVTLDTDWSAQESLGSSVFPEISTQNNVSKTLTGWAAGGGIEWFFKSNWSARLEYIYYCLNDIDTSVTLAQINEAASPPVLWGAASADTALSVAFGTIRSGISYHFS